MTLRTAAIAPAAVHETLARHMLADGYDRPRAIGSDDLGELFDARTALAHPGVPAPDPGRMDLKQDLVFTRLRHGDRGHVEDLRTSELVDHGRFHRFWQHDDPPFILGMGSNFYAKLGAPARPVVAVVGEQQVEEQREQSRSPASSKAPGSLVAWMRSS